MDNLFSTHPATENRIAALMAMAREPGAPTAGPVAARAAARPSVAVPRVGTTGRQPGPWG
jgi:heat shock protein HtpX